MSFKLQNIWLLVALVPMLGGCYDSHTQPIVEYHIPTHSTSIADVKSMAKEMERLPEGVEIVGRVTANDFGGNFYRRIVVEDPSGALEVHIGLYDLAALYPVGAMVRVRCGGLVAMEREGVLQLGGDCYPWSDYRVEPIAPRSEVDYHVEVCGPVESLIPLETLSAEDCGRLVRMRGVRFVGSESDWGSEEYGTEASREFTTEEGERFVVATSRYADFAREPIPERALTLTGILYCDEETYIIRLRNEEDVE